MNAATQTAVKNMLKRVSGILNSIAGDMLQVSQQHIDEILSNSVGDVRSAVLNLIFISLKGIRVILIKPMSQIAYIILTITSAGATLEE